ncbi:hypothetical protein PMI13_02434 [Chryseobacterium populi]|uniref:Uncharacterized protein n=2 Tax=Chryseobacterium populi TaxID=1144316 RepID=J2KDK8_9FLAO|nr:hypothetical protein PMI13_02434 [Chryseobacterium populi]
MQVKNIHIIFSSAILILLVVWSCKSKEVNYITYYNKVNKIDSIYRMANKPKKAIRKYRRLFRRYEPKNQERINEYANYIILSDQYHKNFGGQQSLYKLLPLIAPYNKQYKDYLKLYKKYGIDSVTVEKEIVQWKKSLNKQLVDSFTVAMIQDRGAKADDSIKHHLILKKNAELLIWTFNHYGFPSLQKIGLWNEGEFLAMQSLIDHMSESTYYPYFKTKLLEYIKSGECPPYFYAVMIDKHNLNFTNHKEDIVYGAYRSIGFKLDSTQLDRNRRSIGLPSLRHYGVIKEVFHKKSATKNSLKK